MSKALKIIGTVALVGLAVLYLGVQAVSIFATGYKTEVAVSYVMADSVTAQSVIIRQESVLTPQNQGYYGYAVTDGSKVSGGQLLASVYGSAEDSAVVTRTEQVRSELATMTQFQNTETSFGDPESLSNQILNTAASAQGAFHQNTFTGAATYKNQLITQISRRQAATGKVVDLSGQIAALQAELDALQAQAPSQVAYEYAQSSGYFSSVVDGFEGKLTPDTVQQLTADEVKKIINGEETPDEHGNFGRLVADFDWYLACVLPSDNTWVSEGKTLYMDFLGVTSESIPGQVLRVVPSGDEMLVIISCDMITKDLVNLRIQNVQISQKLQKGIRVPEEALRVQDNKKGVYVKKGGKAVFREINILLQENGYLLVEEVVSDPNALKVYDEVIIKGKDIYDGKLLS
ncbi:putative membrane fusion protein [Anaerotruncus sp. 2789STDY5834896]|uniref:Putative membrane fusion protein n=1 Tax=uncultured Anaerotruncus sp. TaxID=905011 RepID=A0A1C6GYK4_9FIRM|nr:putative membrane fusion protein [uncultured Anaerotruncus sp.]